MQWTPLSGTSHRFFKTEEMSLQWEAISLHIKSPQNLAVCYHKVDLDFYSASTQEKL